MRWIYLVLIAVFIISINQAHADNFRCPNGNIVSTGYSISTVAAKCDTPASSFKREEPIEVEESRTDSKTGTKTIYNRADQARFKG